MFCGKVCNESGAALLFVLLMLALLSVVGLSGSGTTEMELRIAGNEKAHTLAFYFAEGGNELSKELLEQGIAERGWTNATDEPVELERVTLLDSEFYLSDELGDVLPDAENRDAVIDFGQGETALIFGSNTRLSTGGAVQMVAGYEGKGKGAASGGAWIVYDVRSQHNGPNNSSSRVHSQWLHML